MSRCFPFPPPGYEKKLTAENLDLLTKEKRKEKKHKKEKKDKEKREHREKKEKDRSKDKHKEKKDKKDKHRDKKKDRVKASEVRPEIRNELQFQEAFQKAEEGKGSKLAEELGRRIRDDGIANQMAGISPPLHRAIDRVGFARTLLDNETFVDKKVCPTHFSTVQRSDGSSLSIENAAYSPQKRIGNLNTATSADHERSKVFVGFVSNTDQNRNHGILRSTGITSGSIIRKSEYSVSAMEKERTPQKHTISALDRGKPGSKYTTVSSSASTQRKTDFFDFSPENIASIRCKTLAMGNTLVQSRMEGITMLAMEKERISKGSSVPSPSIPHPVISDPRKNPTICQPLELDNRHQKLGKEDTNTKKAMEKAVALNSKPLAPHKNSTKSVDEFTRKRPDLKINGFLQESEARPNKMPRLSPFPQPPARDKSTIICSQPTMNNLKPDRIKQDNKQKKINAAVENGEAPLKPPHPDSKYLEHIYNVPKIEAWPEFDDSGWLFNRDSKQKAIARAKDEGPPPPQVWAKAVWIDSVDTLALPYVVPF